jgi:hypothetical protein
MGKIVIILPRVLRKYFGSNFRYTLYSKNSNILKKLISYRLNKAHIDMDSLRKEILSDENFTCKRWLLEEIENAVNKRIFVSSKY